MPFPARLLQSCQEAVLNVFCTKGNIQNVVPHYGAWDVMITFCHDGHCSKPSMTPLTDRSYFRDLA